MWHPPSPIKHAIPEARWPTRDEAARGLWFRPISLGPVPSHKQVTCKLWDREAIDDADVVLADDGRRRLTAPAWHDGPASGSDTR